MHSWEQHEQRQIEGTSHCSETMVEFILGRIDR